MTPELVTEQQTPLHLEPLHYARTPALLSELLLLFAVL